MDALAGADSVGAVASALAIVPALRKVAQRGAQLVPVAECEGIHEKAADEGDLSRRVPKLACGNTGAEPAQAEHIGVYERQAVEGAVPIVSAKETEVFDVDMLVEQVEA